MNKNKFIISVLVLIIIGGVLFYFYTDKKNKKSDKSNSNISITSNSNSNTTNNSNIESNANSNIESNSNSNIENNSNSNITSNYNSNIESNLNSNKPVSNSNSNKTSNSNPTSNTTSNPTSNKPVNNGLATNGSFSGIFQNDNVKAIIYQYNGEVRISIGERIGKPQLNKVVTMKTAITNKKITVKSSVYNATYTLELKDKGINLVATSNLKSGFLPKIQEYTSNNYYNDYIGKLNGIRGIYSNKYGTIKIYQTNDNSLKYSGVVKQKNAYTDEDRQETISGTGSLNLVSTNYWSSSDQKSQISLKLSGNSIIIESDSNTIRSFEFHAGKYFDKNKNAAEPNANVYTKTSDYSINRIIAETW